MLSGKYWNNKASDIKLVCLYSTIKMMHGPINITCVAVLHIQGWTRQHKTGSLRTGQRGNNEEACVTKSSRRSVLLQDIAWWRAVIPYRRFGTTYQSHVQGSTNPDTEHSITEVNWHNLLWDFAHRTIFQRSMTFRKSALILFSGKGAPYVADHQIQQSLGTTEIITFDICTGEQI